MIENFVAFILTHGRADRVYTYATLRKHGYTGPIRLVIDNEDKQAEQYYKNFPGEVIMFDKPAIAKEIDEGDNFHDRRAIIYARNVCFKLAEDLGYEYFIELDDDYTEFKYKYGDGITYNKYYYIKNLDAIFWAMLNYYKTTPFLSIAMAQGGDFLGGNQGDFARSYRRRKCMNSFICSTKRPFQFFGKINEDVNTYVNLGSRGGLFMTIANVGLEQKQTQSNAGGMTDIYLDSGTYIKSFYTVMYHPSGVLVAFMRSKNKRLHHTISWNNTVPQIVPEEYKKASNG